MRKFAYLFMLRLLWVFILVLPAIQESNAATLHTEDPFLPDTQDLLIDQPLEPVTVDKQKTDQTPKIIPLETNDRPPEPQSATDATQNQNPPSQKSPDKVNSNLEPAEVTVSPKLKKRNIAPSNAVLKQGYEQLNEIIDENTLNDTLLIVKDINTQLNEFNNKVNQKLSPAIEELFILQKLFSTSGEQDLFVSNVRNQTNQIGTFTEIDLNSDAEELAEIIPVEEVDGFLGFIIKLPKYFFNIKNVIILVLTLFIISGLLRILHYLLNKMY